MSDCGSEQVPGEAARNPAATEDTCLCKLIYTKNNSISFHFLNLSLLLVSQYSRHLCANSSPEHLANPLMPDGPADAEQNRE